MAEQIKKLNLKDTYLKKWLREYWAISLIFSLAFFEMSWLSVHRALGFNMFWHDLGVMTQSIYSVLSGKILESSNSFSFLAESRLSGHVEVIFFFFAPLFLIYKSPISLLVAQAFLYATGGIAFFLIGKKLKNNIFGIWLATFYLWYPIAQSAVLFDFHGDTIAMPILAWALYAFTLRSWKAYYFLIILALLCKIYVALPVSLLGLILFRKGYKKQGLITFFFAVTWGLIAIFVLRGAYVSDPIAKIQSYVSVRNISKTENFINTIRFFTLLIIITPLIPYLKKFSIWLLPALAIVIPAFLLHGYQYFYHHYAIAVPFIIYSLAEEYIKDNRKISEKNGLAILMLVSCLGLNFLFTIYYGPRGIKINKEPTNAPERSLLLIPWINKNISNTSPITASQNLSPFLSMRSEIYQTSIWDRNGNIPMDYVAAGEYSDFFVVDSFLENYSYAYLYVEREVLQWLAQNSTDFQLKSARDGVFIFSKNTVESKKWIEPSIDLPLETEDFYMGNGITLEGVGLDATFLDDEWNFKFSYYWKNSSKTELSDMYATTRLDGYPASRSLHLGSWAIYPVSNWNKNERYQDFVYLNIPHIPGCYPITVGWHDPLARVVAADKSAIEGKSIIWGYWQMEEEYGKGELVSECDFNSSENAN